MKKTNSKNNKGFTLVELIVVLVILAILAAILVPALLGYIDRAREKQYVLNAKSFLTATQAEFSSIYGEGKKPAEINNRKTTVVNTADVATATSFTAYCKKDEKAADVSSAVSDNHAAYTVKYAVYVENGVTLYFDGSSWMSVTSAPDPSGYTAYKILEATTTP
ncbi:MAG: type II secretion system GspH family protein [Lachnospiraceae bacterium]|nr:type II secretion system GspH family protein [Lachnospiraceae bacterium]